MINILYFFVYLLGILAALFAIRFTNLLITFRCDKFGLFSVIFSWLTVLAAGVVCFFHCCDLLLVKFKSSELRKKLANVIKDLKAWCNITTKTNDK